jgi:hypothetical protein
MTEVVKFDENENAVKGNWPCTAQVCPLNDYSIAMAGRYDVQTDESLFPLIAADAGWAYINVGRQGWVTTTMQSHGIFSVAADAVALGNGCSPLAPRSTISDGTHVIGPSNP